MIATEPNKIYINKEPLERMLRIPFDARTELDRAEQSLDYSLNAKPIFNFNTSALEAVARVKAWYDARLAEIARAEQQYRQRLTEARKAGTIETSDYSRALIGLEFSDSPFSKARKDAGELYRREVKFD